MSNSILLPRQLLANLFNFTVAITICFDRIIALYNYFLRVVTTCQKLSDLEIFLNIYQYLKYLIQTHSRDYSKVLFGTPPSTLEPLQSREVCTITQIEFCYAIIDNSIYITLKLFMDNTDNPDRDSHFKCGHSFHLQIQFFTLFYCFVVAVLP